MNNHYTEVFNDLIAHYKTLISTQGLDDEIYKWKFVKANLGKPDLNANDFVQEIKLTTKTNLVYNLSAAVLIDLSQNKPDELKALIRDLHDESTDLQLRINNYITESEKLYDEIKTNPAAKHSQDERTIAFLLTLKYPAKYTIYKDSFYRKLCNLLGINSRRKNQKLIHYYELVDLFIEHGIRKDAELTDMVKSRLTDDAYHDPEYKLLAQDILYQTLEGRAADQNTEKGKITRRVWVFLPGKESSQWDKFKAEGIAAIGWDFLGNLNKYKSHKSVREAIRDHTGKIAPHDTLACWEFANVMKPGDIIVPKKGRHTYTGYGIVTSGYEYDEQQIPYPNIRRVNWVKVGEWLDDGSIVTKTLTDISKYPSYVKKLSSMLGFDVTEIEETAANEPETDYDGRNCWWLNANPKHWDLSSHMPGSHQTYTTHAESGNKRRVYKYFQMLKPGDLIIGYETTPRKRVVARLVITQGIYLDEEDQECIEFRVDSFYPNQPSWDELQHDKLLAEAEVFNNNQGSLFRLRKEEFDRIETLAIGTEKKLGPYTVADAIFGNFLDEKWLHDTLELWKTKKNLVLQGPPGTGKTFVAERLAWLIMGEKDPARLHMVQFHPSYSYEDFIEGYRPDGNGGFDLRSGHFLKFCRLAASDPGRNYVFIIDEINRGNLSKVFGEVMMGIEADKRDKAIHLQYGTGDKFSIPTNLYLIGTMNTADRSLAVVDYALRRRFVFKNMQPDFGNRFGIYLTDKRVESTTKNRIISMMSELNEVIRSDSSLGTGFAVGHSYFCAPPADAETHAVWLRNIIEFELVPLIEEYWFDQPDQVSKSRSILGLP